MAFTSNRKFILPVLRTLIGKSQKTSLQSSKAAYSCIANQSRLNTTIMAMQRPSILCQHRPLGSDQNAFSSSASDDKPVHLSQALEREIQEEVAELNQRLSSDQFPGFSVETNDSDVKLTKQVGDTTVVVQFTVSSSIAEWRTRSPEEQSQADTDGTEQMMQLMSMPNFQVQFVRGARTFEVSCFFEEMDLDEDTGEPYNTEPIFQIDEIVMYNGQPKETEFAVSTEYFRDELLDSLVQYLADHGIDEEFSKNLIAFSTNYEKKQYIGLMKRLKDFVSE